MEIHVPQNRVGAELASSDEAIITSGEAYELLLEIANHLGANNLVEDGSTGKTTAWSSDERVVMVIQTIHEESSVPGLNVYLHVKPKTVRASRVQ